MANHVKPTKAELKAAADAAAAKVDAMTPDDFIDHDQDDPPATPPVTPPTPPVDDNPPATPPVTPPVDATPPTPPVTPPTADTPPADAGDTPPDNTQPDWKKRYTDSSREAKVLAIKNKELNSVVDEASQLADPTDDEMKAEYPEWEEMTGTEQRLAKGDLLNKKRFELIHGATQKYKKIEDWNERVDTYIADPKTLIANPELEGKQEEFTLFASKPTRAGMDFEDLVLAFLGDEAKKIKPNNKGTKMFEDGTGGSNEIPKPPDNKLSVQQSIIDRQTNYKLWKERLRAGKYKNE